MRSRVPARPGRTSARSPRLLRAGVALCAALARPPAAHAQGAGPGAGYDYVFQVSQHTEDERGRTRREPAFVARARHRGSLVRVDFLPGTEGSNTPGDWYLTSDGGRSLTLVDERRRTHHLLNVAAVREQVSDEKGLDVSVADLAVAVRPEGACGEVGGWATTCFTVDRRYVVRTRFWTMRAETEVVERVRYWTAPALTDLATPLGTFFSSRTDLLVRRDSGFVAREREVARAVGPGAVLRMEVTHTETTGRARVRRTRVVETFRVRRAAHDERLFEVPPGYRLVRR
jgi:hypothetical protein